MYNLELKCSLRSLFKGSASQFFCHPAKFSAGMTPRGAGMALGEAVDMFANISLLLVILANASIHCL